MPSPGKVDALVQALGERHRLARAENPSFRAASCCSVEVVNGGAGERLRSLRSTFVTR